MYPHLVGWTLWAPGQGEPPAFLFYQVNTPRGAIFVCWPPHNFECKYPHLVGWTLQALGWGEPPTNKILHGKPTPRSNFCLLALVKFTKHIPPLGRVLWTPGLGEPPTNKILHGKPTPKSNFCLLAPAQFFTLQGISDRVSMGGTPGGQHLGSPPGSVLSQGEMRSPRQISG
jgi:hypothetical protein